MISTNPFLILADSVPPILMQSFVILMGLLILVGTVMDIIHKKNVKYFFENAKKAKLSASKTLSTGERISVISKTIASDIATTSELGAGKRRLAHVMGMYGTILFWIGSVVMIFWVIDFNSFKNSVGCLVFKYPKINCHSVSMEDNTLLKAFAPETLCAPSNIITWFL